MKKFALFATLLLSSSSGFSQVSLASSKTPKKMENNIYDYTVKDLSGNLFDFADLRGKKILIVNTASECGFTPQYKQLEEIYEKYKDHNFVIVGFPSNDFGQQEPGDNEKIAKFCEKNYGVTFPMMSKTDVKGSNKAPIYKFLTEKSLNKFKDSEVAWNFQKYLIDERGRLVNVLLSKVAPDDAQIISWIEGR